ncbi:MAG: ABC transporter substrate-binding protein [Methylobacteriaceae bacterium]|nr:ABC transporter substrate-binding protein [Methylobacteriaceae bacterium]MBV9221220.1 ABC transporter substrate-binding protein [Methylobacteriaceae bacterium]MBV9247161.1 ABC transporter substrate-binding protein [Methylobacteriaceae bacterium]MBV9637013.1 ABC transporter substrate-binding protein [Methylobacteriaceae bacterium]MBV9705228.1 ABC transporter substrate-binding protein [Methylobacteriaceae bacterium]
MFVGLALASAGAEAATRGGTLIYARYADSLFLDPVLNDANVDIWILTNLYDTLLAPTSDGQGVSPSLATKWDVATDGKTVTLTLRSGVKFSDGSPLTPQDVKWSLDRARDPKAGAWNFTLAAVDTIETGPDTVVLKLKHADPTLLPALATFNAAILPQKQFEASSGSSMEEKAKAFAEHPIGTGPFAFVSWKRGEVMKLKRNDYYWKMGEDGKPLPYLDALEFPVIPDDSTRLLKLKAGEIDGTEFVPYARVKDLQADPSLRMELWPSTRVRYLTLYVGDKYKDGSPNPISNPKVRQALNYAINKDAVIQITTLNLGKPMRSYMSSSTPLFSGAAPLYPYDPAKAKALLAEAGFANGFSFSCLSLSGNGDDANDLTAAQQMWAQIGVKLKIEQVDNPTRTAKYRAEDFQCRTSAWTDDIADPSEITSYFAYYPNIHSLHSGFDDKRIDELFEKSQEENDKTARTAEYKEIQDRYNSAAPIVYLYETPYPVAFRKNAKGFVQIPLGNNLFESAYIEK